MPLCRQPKAFAGCFVLGLTLSVVALRYVGDESLRHSRAEFVAVSSPPDNNGVGARYEGLPIMIGMSPPGDTSDELPEKTDGSARPSTSEGGGDGGGSSSSSPGVINTKAEDWFGPVSRGNITFQGSKAVVQIMDHDMPEYIYGILSTHQAMKDMGMFERHAIDHVIVYKGAPPGFTPGNPDTYADYAEVKNAMDVIIRMNLTIIPYRNDAVYGDILGMVVDHQERAKKKEEEGKPENKNKNKIENKNKKSHKGMKTAEDVKDHLTEVFKENHMQKFMAKIHVFNLTMYDRILFLDNDIIPLHDFTSLFDVPKTPACAPDVASGFVLNTGVLVVDPNRTTYVSMMMDLMRPDPVPWRSASKGDEKVDNDQDFINYFFASSLYVLSPYWNVLISIHHDGLGGGGETSPVTEWGAFVEESGRFIQWMLKFKRNRRMVQMVHMGFPKPTWPQFQKKCAPMNPIDEKTKYAKGWEIPSTWKCPKGEVARPLWWRWYVIDSGEPGLAVLALFKTFWARYSRLIDALCEQRGSGYGGVHPPACKMSALRVLTTDMEMVGRDVMETLLANPKIPTWEETLRR